MIENRFYMELFPWSNAISLHMHQKLPDGSVYRAHNLEYTQIKDDALAPLPLMSISTADAQQLMDELWRVGLRPSEGSGSAGSLKATENHLKDMRKIALNLLMLKE